MDNNNLVEKGEGLLVAEAMGDNYPTICIDSYVDSKDGGFKVRTVTIYDDVVVEVLRTLCQLDSIGDKKYKGVIDSPEYELCEYNQKTKKRRVFKLILDHEDEIPDELIPDYQEEEIGGQA